MNIHKGDRLDKIYRHELKYNISKFDFNIIYYRLNGLLKTDIHSDNGEYMVSSIYFDTYSHTSYYQVVDGIGERWKYRIRYYNDDLSYIVLEKKYKINAMTNKQSVVITQMQLENILQGRDLEISSNNPALLNEFYIKILTEYLRPVIVITYKRVAYICDAGTVRITLDFDIGSSKEFDILSKGNRNIDYLPDIILEIKYTEFLPDYIRYNLALNHLEQISFSKFRNCIDQNGGSLL